MHDSDLSLKIRWWPLAVILGLCPLSWAFIWSMSSWTQSVRVFMTIQSCLWTVFLLLLWFLFFSRLPLKIKLIGLASFTALSLFLVSAVEIRGVNGDVLPIRAWSWTPRADEGLASMPVTAEDGNIPEALSENDFPRFLGLHSTGIAADIDLARDWQTQPPQERWRIPVGAAWSGFAVKGGLAVTQEQRGESEMVTCYSLATGELIWAHGDPQRFATTVGGTGPRATPTIAGDKVYTFGALGLLNCLDLATGTLVWQRPVAEENGAEKPLWGYSCSPLVLTGAEMARADEKGVTRPGAIGALVVVSPGGADGHSLVAYRAEDGAVAWADGSAKPGYSSPELARLAGAEMILIFNNGSVAGHHPGDGRILWEVPWPGDKPCVANPRCLPGDRLLVSAGYGLGSKMYRILKQGQVFTANLVYESPRLKAKFANFIVRDGYAYGLDDGVLTCMDTATGERVWKKGRYGHGQLLLADKTLLVQTEGGELLLLEARPDVPEVLASMPVLSGKSWNTFALAGNLLLMRNHKEAVCLELARR